MIVKDVEQNTPEWEKARTGMPTSSNFDEIITTRCTPSKQKQKFMYQLAAERITGVKEETYKNAIMLRGIEMEPEARSMYELLTGNEVTTVGICYLNKKKLFGCSPDGLVGEDGLIEIKCPTSAVHVSYLLANGFPKDYFQQLQGQLFVTGRKWVDFFSYYPGIKPLLFKVMPDRWFIKALETELEAFCKELDEVTERLKDI